MEKAPPKPVSTSTSNGSGVAAVMREASSATSVSVVMARSGRPKAALATPAPERYSARAPLRCASKAQ
jgi:hypothetical protein